MESWKGPVRCRKCKKELRMFVCCSLGALLLLMFTVSSNGLWNSTGGLYATNADEYSSETSQVGNLTGIPADSPTLIRHLKEEVILPPSTLPYHLFYGPQHDPSDGQSAVIDGLLGGLRDGFYVESGAYTGEVMSNTLFFETRRGWQGLLIEPDVTNFAKIRTRHRKAHTANACLAETNHPDQRVFQMDKYSGRIVSDTDTAVEELVSSRDDFEVTRCYPLFAFLLALGHTTVDYLSLDVEASEYRILSTVPWDKVDIRTLSVEYNLIREGKEALIQLMTSLGYIHYMEFNRPYTHDVIFVKPELLTPERIGNTNWPILDETYESLLVNFDTR